MKNETQKIDGYWVIRTNKWDANIYTQEQAEKYADTLINCENCTNCRDCRNCRYCIDCIDCSYCRNCSDCSDCSYFKSNPQRITSPKLGSRNSQTTYYWNDENEQIVCGCFKGTLDEFEEKVKKTHGDNHHAKDYLKWIDAVKFYKQNIRR